MSKIDVLDLLELLLETGVVEVRIKVNLSAEFLDELKKAAEDKEIKGPEAAKLMRLWRKG